MCLNELIRLYASTPGCKVYIPRQLGIDAIGMNVDTNSCYPTRRESTMTNNAGDFNVVKMNKDDNIGVLKFIDEIDAHLNFIGRGRKNHSEEENNRNSASMQSVDMSTFMDSYENVTPSVHSSNGPCDNVEYLDFDAGDVDDVKYQMRPRQIAEHTFQVIHEAKKLDDDCTAERERFLAEYKRISEESIRENEFRIRQKMQQKSTTLASRIASQMSFATDLSNWRKLKESNKKRDKFACKSRFNILLQDNLPYEDYPRKQVNIYIRFYINSIWH